MQFSGNRVRPNVLTFRPTYTSKYYANLLKIIWGFKRPKKCTAHIGSDIKLPTPTVRHLHAHSSIQHRTHTCDFVHVHTPSIIRPMYIGSEAFTPATDRESAKALFARSVERIEVETHSYCNRRCDYCPNTVGDRLGANQRMAGDIWFLLLSNLREIDYAANFIFTSYNEPLADKIILQRIREAREQRIQPTPCARAAQADTHRRRDCHSFCSHSRHIAR